MPNSFFPQSRFSVDEEDSADMNPEDNIFEAYEYDNYNEILNNFNRQFTQLTYEGINETINSIISGEKNYIFNEKESMQNQIKNFDDFKKEFINQKNAKKEELKNLYLSGKLESSKNDLETTDKNLNIKKEKEKEENDKIVEIELSSEEVISEKLSTFKKYPNSVLAAYLNCSTSLPKRNGRIFFDREPMSFKLLVYYLANNKLPKFKNISEEKKFFKEINYWKIPIHISSKNILKFNKDLSPHFFTLDANYQILTKSNMNHGIILLNKKLSAVTPYIEFSINLNNRNHNRKILLALVDESKIEKSDLNKSFENNVPFVFYWDLLNEKIVKNNKKYFNRPELRSVDLNKFCRCYKNNYEIKFGLLYNHIEHSVELIRDDVKLDIVIQNIDPGLTPAFEIHSENCRIQLSSRNKYQEKFYL